MIRRPRYAHSSAYSFARRCPAEAGATGARAIDRGASRGAEPDRAAGCRRVAEQADRRHAEGGSPYGRVVARTFSATRYRRPSARCAPARTHPVDLLRSDRPFDRENDPEYPSPCHALVHAHDGESDGNLQGFGITHLAGERPEAPWYRK